MRDGLRRANRQPRGKENGICFPNGKEQLKEKSPIGTGERGIVKSESMKEVKKKKMNRKRKNNTNKPL